MSNNILDTLEVKEFEKEVHQSYQEEGNTLAECTRYRRINGNKTQFPILGTLAAAERIIGTPVVATNQSASAVEITTTKYSVAQWTDIFLQGEVNFDAKQESAKAVAMAAGRKVDQVVIDALELLDGSYTNTVGVAIGGSNTNLNVAKLAQAAKQLDINGVPQTDRYGIIHTNSHHSLTQETTVASSDYNSNRVLKDGRINDYYGFEFKQIGNLADEDGLTLASNVRNNFLFQKSAIGLVMGMEINVEIEYHQDYGAHLVTAFFSAGSKVIDELGISFVDTHEA
tara:strand:- start:731 stop:1582 length:852 start_codon:yes stop_codon:yes gene_type:complete